MGNVKQTVRGMYCLRCSSRKVVRGSLGESARFYPLRGLFKSLLAKPVFYTHADSHACLDCGLTWNELDPASLRRNLRDYGLSPHSTGVMQVVRGDVSEASFVDVAV
jgi:hypothetical protein